MTNEKKFYRIGPISRAYKQATLFWWEGAMFSESPVTKQIIKGDSFEEVFDTLVAAVNRLKEKGYQAELKG